MTTPRVLAIGLDSAEWSLLERHMADGELPTIQRLLEQGGKGDLDVPDLGDLAWPEFLSGRPAQTLRYASTLGYATDYTVQNVGAYDFEEFQPFYTDCPGRKIIVFDVPQARLTQPVDGVQILGWGSHSPLSASVSDPPGLMADLATEFGIHPAFGDDWMHVTLTEQKWQRLERAFLTGIERRARIGQALMTRYPWDLMLMAFSETHAAGHGMWHLSGDHSGAAKLPGADPLRSIHRAIDRAIAELVATAGPDTRVILFSGHGMRANSDELGTLVFLPELLYRHSFGKAALARGSTSTLPPPSQARGDWGQLMWSQTEDPNPLRRAMRRHAGLGVSRRLERVLGGTGLEHPYTTSLHYMPPLWYRPFWPEMTAFALPGFAHGFVRLNVRGRERDGIVPPEDFEKTCNELTALISGLTDARTGEPVVSEVVRTRQSPAQESGELDADLVVKWLFTPVDVVDTPGFGRIGPVPFRQPGGHHSQGFVVVAGPGVPSGPLPRRPLRDLAPMILELLDQGVVERRFSAMAAADAVINSA
jgi:predicted AlkP superfamily phosphohydrolase/phosphomutase